MRKFFISLFIFLPMMSAHAATYNCIPKKIDTFSWKYSDEFIFTDKANWENATGFICGHNGVDGCDAGAEVLMPRGYYHINKRWDINEYSLYRCDKSGGGHSWEYIMGSWCKTDGTKYSNIYGDYYSSKNGTWLMGAYRAAAGGICKQPSNTCFYEGKFYKKDPNTCIPGTTENDARGKVCKVCVAGCAEAGADGDGVDYTALSANDGYRLRDSSCGTKWFETDPDAVCDINATDWFDIKYWDENPKKVNCSRFLANDLKTARDHGSECYILCVDGSLRGAVKTCKNGYKPRTQSNPLGRGYYVECVPKSQSELQREELQKCMKSRKNSEQGQACCYLSASEAEWKQVDGEYKCVCADTNKEFQIGTDKHGQCVPRAAAPQQKDPEPDAVVKCKLLNGTELDVGSSLYGLNQTALTLEQCKIYVDATKITDDRGTGFLVICRDGGDAVCKAVKCPDTENFVLDAENGRCNPVVKKFECDEESLRLLDTWNVDYSDEESIVAAVSDALAYCKDDARTADGFNGKMTALRGLIAGVNQAREQQRRLEQQLRDVSDKLNSMNQRLGQSHWKNEEGKFNTARLASDSIAGVVLGTAGGLITSNIMKKNQVSGGFEKLQCVIGGQTVAGWGDEFMVGRQR